MLFIFPTSRCPLLPTSHYPRSPRHACCPLLLRHAAIYFRVTHPSTSYVTLSSTSASRCPLRPHHAALYFRITLPSTSYITLPSTSASRCPLLPSALFRATLPSTSACPLLPHHAALCFLHHATFYVRATLPSNSVCPLLPRHALFCFLRHADFYFQRHAVLYFPRHAALYFVCHKPAHSFSDDDGKICLHGNASQHVPSLGSGGTSPAVEDHRNVTGALTMNRA